MECLLGIKSACPRSFLLLRAGVQDAKALTASNGIQPAYGWSRVARGANSPCSMGVQGENEVSSGRGETAKTFPQSEVP